jgi:hypothetical protein
MVENLIRWVIITISMFTKFKVSTKIQFRASIKCLKLTEYIYIYIYMCKYKHSLDLLRIRSEFQTVYEIM